MLKSGVFAFLLLAAAIATPGTAGAHPAVPEKAPAISNIVPTQGYWERCRWIRERIRVLEGRLYYAPPWERPRIERRLFERREEFRASCRRWY